MTAVYLRRALDEGRLAIIFGFCVAFPNIFIKKQLTKREGEPDWSQFTNKLKQLTVAFTEIILDGSKYYLVSAKSLLDLTTSIPEEERVHIAEVSASNVGTNPSKRAQKATHRTPVRSEKNPLFLSCSNVPDSILVAVLRCCIPMLAEKLLETQAIIEQTRAEIAGWKTTIA